jgi:hypothetical protein
MTPRSRRRASCAIALVLIAGASTIGTLAPTVGAQSSQRWEIAAVGDIACQSFSQSDGEGACRSDEVAALVTRLAPDYFFPLGDIQYNNGKLTEFLKVYDKQFGHLMDVTMPTPGNHEYGTADAAGYFAYFGARAHGPEGYYSFDVGPWHVVSLNSDICRDDPGCGRGTPQYEWLRADLAAHPAACTLAFQHHPTFDWRQWQKFVDPNDPRPNGGSENVMYLPMWRLMDQNGVDVMLNGHNHIYHRWAPQDVDGNRDPDGIRQFTVGTGGRSLYPLGKKPRPENLVALQNKAFGVLSLSLFDGGYDYEWVGLPTDPRYHDAGTFACR